MQQDDSKDSILNDKKYKLFGPRDDKGGAATLNFDVYRGNPSISVWTNDPNDPEKKPIRAGMDGVGFNAFVAMVNSVAESAEPVTKQLELLTGPPNKVFVDSSVVVGKDAEGVMFMAVRKKGRPTKKFEFIPSVYFNMIDGQGNPLGRGPTSVLWAKGYIDVISKIVNAKIQETYAPYDPSQNARGKGGFGGGNRGGQGGGGYNQGGGQGNQGGGYSAPTAGFDDDIPM